MNKIIQLKIACMLLFWFGVIAQIMTASAVQYQYSTLGYSPYLNPSGTDIAWIMSITIAYFGFIHFVHMLTGYWLAKGTMKGLVLGLGVSVYEILPFIYPQMDPILYTPYGVTIRILFAFVIYLIISGRKELNNLKYQSWRPWQWSKIISTQ